MTWTWVVRPTLVGPGTYRGELVYEPSVAVTGVGEPPPRRREPTHDEPTEPFQPDQPWTFPDLDDDVWDLR